MRRLLSFLCASTAFCALPNPVFAASSPLADEVHELRRDLQLQGKKIDALTQKIADLTALIRQREETRPEPQPAPAAALPPTVATPSGTAPREAPPAVASTPENPKAAPAPTLSHVVAKGETLTAIAKQYNVNLSDLLKLNKNTNDRKLQIGQTLKVPAVKPAEAAPAEPAAATPITP